MPTTYAIPDGRTAFAATIWTGVSTSAAITISNAVNGVSFKPDFVWEKPRSLSYTHSLSNSVVGTNIRLNSAATTTEDTNFTYGYTSSFNSDGFTASPGSTDNENWNTTGATFVAWQWKASNATAVSNTSGSITSQVSANTTAGFSVVTWTAPASTGTHTVGHGLGVAPSMIIAKSRSGGTGGLGWAVYFTTLGNSAGLALNTTAASFSSSNYWGSSNPTSTVFGLNDAASATGYDNNTGNMVAYCFAPVAGYSAFGSFVANGSADGPFVYLGFRPRFVMFKDATTAGGYWEIHDTSRSTYNATTARLWPNVSSAEATGADIDFLSNGFKVRTTDGTINNSGSTVIYAAFAENPFKYANAR
jgi:hypothetical protein